MEKPKLELVANNANTEILDQSANSNGSLDEAYEQVYLNKKQPITQAEALAIEKVDEEVSEKENLIQVEANGYDQSEKMNSLNCNNESVEQLLKEIASLKEKNKEKKNRLEQLEKDIVCLDNSEEYL